MRKSKCSYRLPALVARVGSAIRGGDWPTAIWELREADDPSRTLDEVQAFLAFCNGDEAAEKAVASLRTQIASQAGFSRGE